MKFTGEEVGEFVFEYDVETIEGESRRWSRTNQTIIEYNGKFYSLYWEEGLTENQDNEFEEQDAPEVKQIEETKIVVSWVKV